MTQLVRFLVVFLCLSAAGCSTMRYVPPGGQLAPQAAAPTELRAFSGQVVSDFDLPGGYASPGTRTRISELAAQEMAAWFEGEGDDISVSLRHENTSDRGYATMVLYFLTLGLLPSWVTTEGQSVMQITSGETVLFENRESYTYKSALSVWLPTAMAFGTPGSGPADTLTRDQLNRHKLALGQRVAGQMAAYEAAVAGDTVAAYRDYLRGNPESLFRMETLRRLAAKAPARNAHSFHRDNLALDPAYVTVLPDEYDIWFLGPEGMTVYDILQLSASEDEVLLVSRIRAAGAPYKVFSSDEIAHLREAGMPSTLIAAMIDASGAQRQDAGAAAAMVGDAALPAGAAPQAAPGVGDIAAQCAKRYAAMKACDKVPSFGATVCRSQVKKTYNHLACELID